MLSIGKHLIPSPYFLAPMAGVSEMPFRVIALQMGAGLATTELISAKGIFFKNARTQSYLRYDPQVEKPYSLQLFGGEELSMCRAAEEAVRLGADIIDINMGCPVKKVTQTGAGSALLTDVKRAASMVRSICQAIGTDAPVTAKIRTGWDSNSINCFEMGSALQDAGCAAIALHGRTRAQGYSGKADWDLIRQFKERMQIPVIGNGDIESAGEARRRQIESGCDAVMIGRGALGNPWIFRDLTGGSPPSSDERCDLILKHFFEQIRFGSLKSFRSHLVWYSKGFENSSLFRSKVMTLEKEEEVSEAIEQFFRGKNPNSDLETTDFVDYRQAFG
ncbi:MAG: tRNA dihydrouridine synthase DusB [Myxococcaceae bacterium]|nr:tRNA dihydrouridine synthase DusB [Myxococcaceae bacterium]MBH2006008.1 tRNA dihydrouridine synthase DusB [Myxococcaceae bacterium]